MNSCSAKGLTIRYHQAVHEKRCPECGLKMAKVDQSRESNALFIWYQCSKNNCEGQWLQKISMG